MLFTKSICLTDEVEVAHVVNNSSLKVVITSADLAGKYVRVSPQCPTLKHIVLMERPDEALVALAAQHGVALVYWYDLYAKVRTSAPLSHDISTAHAQPHTHHRTRT